MTQMKRINSNYHKLQVLRKANPKLRKAIISNCNKELLNAISEIALNVLQVNIELPATSRQKLRKHKTALRALADRRKLLRRSAVKRRVLNQRGGFILQLLGAVLPTIASLLFK
jgi:site-specific DNA-adenine methylase